MLNRTPARGQRTSPLRPESGLWAYSQEKKGRGEEAKGGARL